MTQMNLPVRYKPSKARTVNLPTEITAERVRDATLPVKVDAARRAIAACTDLPELLKYKSQAEGLAAAVKTMKEAPEMIANVNRLVAEAWRKGGELLSQYSAAATGGGVGGWKPSARTKKAKDLGLKVSTAQAMIRVAQAPREVVNSLVQRSTSLETVTRHLPRTALGANLGQPTKSQAYNKISSGPHLNGSGGLTKAWSCLNAIPLESFAQLDASEKKLIREKIIKCQELLDEMDRRLGK